MSATVVGQAPAQPNCERPLIIEHDGSGRRWTQRCRATSEETCRPCSATYRRRVRRVADSGRVRYPAATLLLLTLTAPSEVDQHCRRHKACDARADGCEACPCTPEGGVHLGDWNGGCSARWNRFIEQLRRETGIKLQYFRAAEVQRRGALHFHVLIRLPEGRGGALSLNHLRRLAVHFGFGHSVDLAVVEDHRAAGYVAKYVVKSCAARSSMPWVHRLTGEVTNGHGRYRCWTASRHWGTTMAEVRAEQAAWWQAQLGAAAPPAEQAPPAPLDPNSQSYASLASAPLPWGCL